MKKILLLPATLLFLFFIICCGKKSEDGPTNPPLNTFKNPIIAGADPFVAQKDGIYYYMHTVANAIKIWSTTHLGEVGKATSKTVFIPGNNMANSRDLWAPEMYFIDGKWYIYYTATEGADINRRIFVLENSNADPMQGNWVEKGKIFSAGADFFAIDGTLFEYNGSRYFLWSGRPDPANRNLTQNIYISKMTSPWTLEADATMLSTPEFDFEKKGFGVNEGPEILKNNNGKLFLVYSASFCGSDDYSLGQLALKENGNPLIKADWTKSSTAVFSKKPENNAFGPGHNSFFKSPDGKENWIIYHANTLANQGCSTLRNVRMQKFTFRADGSPDFGEPVPIQKEFVAPSGEK